MIRYAILALSAMCSFTTTTQADMVLDQSSPTSGFNLELGFSATTNPSIFFAGETFTVGVAGTLQQITLFAFEPSPGGTAVFEIRPTTASGAPVNNDSFALGRLTVNLPRPAAASSEEDL